MGRLCPPGEGQASSGQESRANQAQPATLPLLLQVGKLRPRDPLPTAGVRGFAGGHRGFLGHQPIWAKPVPRHRGVPAHTEGPPGLGYLERCVCTAVGVGLVPGPRSGAPRFPGAISGPSVPSPRWAVGTPARPLWRGSKECESRRPGMPGPSLPITLGQHRMEWSRSPRGLEARATLLCLHVPKLWVSL